MHVLLFKLTLHLLFQCRFEATCTGSKAQEGVLGERLVYWDVWHYGGGSGLAILQAGYEVRKVLRFLNSPF